MLPNECVDAILIFGRCHNDIYTAARMYETYLDRHTPSARIIERLIFKVYKTGSFHRRRQNRQIDSKNEM